jgi:hypothetical protein
MGTRSTYRFSRELEDDSKEHLVLVYFQYDGYPKGHPLDTAKWLSKAIIVNGFGTTAVTHTYNGIECLAPAFISEVRKSIGSVYIYPMDERGLCGEDYMYDIILTKTNELKMIVCNQKEEVLFDGTPNEYIKKYSE